MTNRGRALTLLAVQLALVLSVAGKYVYERKVCTRVWMRTAQFDPEMPLRGRYLALQLAVDACSLPRGTSNWESWGMEGQGGWRWTVRPVARDGKLVVEQASDSTRPEQTQRLLLMRDRPCDRAPLQERAEYFIGDRDKSPFPLKTGEELWVEVTVPPAGPPRPIQLAISDDKGFRPLSLH